MKTKLRFIVLTLVCAFAGVQGHSQTLIQFWDFNQARPTDGSGLDSCGTTFSYSFSLGTDTAKATWPLKADYSKVPGAKIVYSRPSYHYSATQRDSTLEALGPGGANIYDYSSSSYSYFTKSDSDFAEGNAFLKARNPSDSCIFSLYIPTTGYKGISMQYAVTQSSSKGATYNIFSYSTDGGTSWKHLTKAMDTFNIGGVFYPDTLQVTNPTTVTSVWYPVQIDFSSDPAVNNNPNFIVRFMLAGANTTLPNGNDRYDNFAVWAASPDGINELTAEEAGYNVYPNPGSSRVTLTSTYKGSKLVTVNNILGQIMSTAKMESQQTAIDFSSFASGVYFISIKEIGSGEYYTLKFIKE